MEHSMADGKETKYASSIFEHKSDIMIIVDDGFQKPESKNFFNNLHKIVQSNSSKKLILVSKTSSDKMKKLLENGDNGNFMWETILDNINTADFENMEAIFVKEISFQGKRILLKELIDKKSVEALMDPLTVQELLLGKNIQIGEKPKILKFYIKREIGLIKFNRNILNNVKNLKNHRFAVYGETNFLVENEVDKENVCIFEDDKEINQDISFIILNSENAETQFHHILKKYDTGVSIHLLKISECRIIWATSHICNMESIIDLKPYLERYFVDENAFLQHVTRAQLVIISAPAGMGKSTVLTHLTQTVQNQWVVRIDLVNHCTTLNELKEGLAQERNEFNLNFEITKEHDYSKVILKAFSKNACQEPKTFEDRMFQNFFENGKVLIVFDGFDEIAPYYEDIVLNLVSKLKSLCTNQIWISSRNRFEDILTSRFHTMIYTLNPFNSLDQIKFLESFWESRYKSECQKHKMYGYCYFLIDEFNSVIYSSQMSDFSGIPLHTKMLADVFEENKKPDEEKWEGCFDFVSSNEKDYPNFGNKIENLSGLYYEFVKKKIDDYILEKIGVKDLWNPNVIKKRKRIFEKQHRALSIIGFQHFKALKSISGFLTNEENEIVRKWKEKNEYVGIIDKVTEDGEVIFNHLTYAEYFAFCYLEEKFNEKREGLVEAIETMCKQQDVPLLSHCVKTFLNENLNLVADSHLSFFTHFYNWDILKNNADGKTLLHFAAAQINRPLIFVLMFRMYYIFGEMDELTAFFYLMNFVKKLDVNGNDALYYCNDEVITNFLKGIINNGENGIKPKNSIDFDEIILQERESAQGSKLTKSFFFNCEFEVVQNILKEIKSNAFEYFTKTNSNFYNDILPRNDFTEEYELFKILKKQKQEEKRVVQLMHDATLNNSIEVMEYILKDQRKYFTFENVNGQFKTACYYKLLEMVKFLFRQIPSIYPEKKPSFLHIAILQNTSSEIILFLVEQIGINAVNENGSTPLMLALSSKCGWKKIRILLDSSPDLTISNKNGKTAWHYLLNRDEKDVKRFLEENFTKRDVWPEWINIVWNFYNNVTVDINKKFGTCLHDAVIKNNKEMCEFLIKKGIDINAKDENGKTPLYYFCEKKIIHACLADLLIKSGAYYEEDGNHSFETTNKNVKVLFYIPKRLRDKGVYILENVNAPAVSKNKSTKWHRIKDDYELRELNDNFPEYKNMQDSEGNTPLHLAARNGFLDIVIELLNIGAFNGVKNNDGRTAKDLANDCGHKQIVSHFDEKENEFEKTKSLENELSSFKCEMIINIAKYANCEGLTLLHYAVLNEKLNLAKTFIFHGADVNAKDDKKRNPLFYAIQKNNLEMVKLLLKFGVLLDDRTLTQIENNHCKTALKKILQAFEYICDEEFESLKNYLEKMDFKMELDIVINVKNSKNQSFLEIAENLNSYDTFVYLLSKGAVLRPNHNRHLRYHNVYTSIQSIFSCVREKIYEEKSLIAHIEKSKYKNEVLNVRLINWSDVYDKHRICPTTLVQETIIAEQSEIAKWLISNGAKDQTSEHCAKMELKKMWKL